MSNIRLPNFSLLLASVILPDFAGAQHNAPLDLPFAAAASSTMTSGFHPSAVSLSRAALSSAAIPFAAMPTFTDAAAPTTVPDGSPANHSVLDFYFFFLGLFIIAIMVLYWMLRRKRRRLFTDTATRRQNALAADLERWPGDGGQRRRWGNELRTGRWYGSRPMRVQEGLNERGEAPPAYVAKPQPTHTAAGAGTTPPEWIDMSGKPPDYDGMRQS